MPVRPSQGTIYPNPILMPDTNLNTKLNLYKWQTGTGGYVSIGVSRDIDIVNTDSGGGGGDGGGRSKLMWWLIGGAALLAGIGGVMLFMRRK